MVKAHIGARRTTKNLSQTNQSDIACRSEGLPWTLLTYLASLEVNISSIGRLFATSFELPVVNASKQAQDAGRDPDEGVFVVGTASLEDQNTIFTISGKSLCEHTSSQASSGDDVVIGLAHYFFFSGCGLQEYKEWSGDSKLQERDSVPQSCTQNNGK